MSPKTNKVTIRIATNSMPDHCMDTTTLFPLENLIDFEVRYNVKTSLLNKIQVTTAN